jgi:SRSO17 transposase
MSPLDDRKRPRTTSASGPRSTFACKRACGLDHYEGRSWLGWYHHTALVSAAHGFLTLERQNPNHQRPA